MQFCCTQVRKRLDLDSRQSRVWVQDINFRAIWTELISTSHRKYVLGLGLESTTLLTCYQVKNGPGNANHMQILDSLWLLKRDFLFLCCTASGESSPVSMRSSSTLPIPQPSSAPSTPTRAPGGPQEQEEERGDLIRFYNHVYIKQIKPFALRYSSNSPKNGVTIACLVYCCSLKSRSSRVHNSVHENIVLDSRRVQVLQRWY